MGMWYFWEQYKQLDSDVKKEIQEGVVISRMTTSLLPLDRETHDRVSRFFSGIQRMPRAWNTRPWSSHELLRANNNVENDLFRRMMKRELGL